jgi:hypothetical protein
MRIIFGRHKIIFYQEIIFQIIVEICKNMKCIWIFNEKYKIFPESPEIVDGYVNCSWNYLTSLKGCPKRIGEFFVCKHNKITTLKEGPRFIGGGFFIRGNKLTDFLYSPKTMRTVVFTENHLLTTDYVPNCKIYE